ncbi:hypothetical protein [Paenibacillus sp. V4I7]|uniref:hypothetical protein n=1 Tax=Paenibacillus sp. V4I7 TaxID=3042307 RepID=UPI002787AF4B|nr:hypothetical protein [Paenibacillus sp. V4I7]MDQ0899133.1 hypothetical protein [Paenibacillus sp. V4I7]
MTTKEKLEFLLRETVFDLMDGDLIKIQTKLIEELTIEDIKEELNHWDTLTLPPFEQNVILPTFPNKDF